MFTSLNQRLASALLILTATSTALHADTLKVKKGGLYPTIQAAVNAANSGDTILVSKGVYTSKVEIVNKSGLTLKAAKGGVVLDSQAVAPTIYIQSSPGTTVEGFTIQNNEMQTGILMIQSSNSTVKKVSVGNLGYGITSAFSTNMTIKNCEVENAEVGISAFECLKVTIKNCKVKNASQEGISLIASNCVVQNCSVQASSIGIKAWGKEHVIHKNKISFSSSGIMLGDGAAMKYAEDCLVTENTISNGFVGIITDHMFGGAILKNQVKNTCYGMWLANSGGYFIAQITVDQNVIKGANLGSALSMMLSGCDVTRNKLSQSVVGLHVGSNTESAFERNVCTKNSVNGAHVTDEVSSFSKNKFVGNFGSGLLVTGGYNWFTENKVSGNGGHGVEVTGTDNEFKGNKVNGNGMYGFRVSNKDNDFISNRAKKNSMADLFDDDMSKNSYVANAFSKIK